MQLLKCKSRPVLLVAHRLHPVNSLAVELLLDGVMGHRRGYRRPMPVLLAWRKPDHITRSDFLDRPAPTPCPAKACCHDQSLAERMRMPCGAGAGLETNTG